MKIEPPIFIGHTDPPQKKIWLPAFLSLFTLGTLCLVGYLILSAIPVSGQAALTVTKAQSAEIFSADKQIWRPAKNGDVLLFGEKIRTDRMGWADLQTGNRLAVRMIGDSHLHLSKSRFLDPSLVFFLAKGYLYLRNPGIPLKVVIENASGPFIYQGKLHDLTAFFTVSSQEESMFTVGVAPQAGAAGIFSLKGQPVIRSFFPWKNIVLKEKSKTDWYFNPFSVTKTLLEPDDVAELEEGFKKMPALYSPAERPSVEVSKRAEKTEVKVPDQKIIQAPAPDQTARPVLMPSPKNVIIPSEAVSLFDFHKAEIYKTKSSQAVSSVYADGALEFQYELPSAESLAGILFKIDPYEMEKFKALYVTIAPSSQGGYPENFRVELKSQDRTLRALTGKLSGTGAQTLSFPIRFQAGNKIDELLILLSNAKVGPEKKGSFQIREIKFS